MNLDNLIDEFLRRADFEEGGPALSKSNPWIDRFEENRGLRLPRAFRRLVSYFTFPEFEAGPIWFFPNQGDSKLDFVGQVLADRALSTVTIAAGYLHFARPSSGSYDPVCFDLNDKNRKIVQLDHESILLKDKIVVVNEIGRSFERFMLDFVSGQPIQRDATWR